MSAGERWLAFGEMLTIGALGLVGLCLALLFVSEIWTRASVALELRRRRREWRDEEV
jgi:hypothetical protein